jgi:hypothetical protein
MADTASERTVSLEVAKQNYRELRDAKIAATDAVEQFHRIERDFLREHGWDMTCDNPGSLWLWRKTMPDGSTPLLDLETALIFEKDLQGFDFYDLDVHPDDEDEVGEGD